MPTVLVFGEDPVTRQALVNLLAGMDHIVVAVSDSQTDLHTLNTGGIDLIVAEHALPRMADVALIEELRRRRCEAPAVLIARYGHTLSVERRLQLKVVSYIEQPADEVLLAMLVAEALQLANGQGDSMRGVADIEAPHALRRWSGAVARGALSSRDMRTVQDWGREIGISRGGLRNWCRSAGISAKASLALTRLLRAVLRQTAAANRPQDLLDIVDSRTLAKLLKAAGCSECQLPATADALLRSQRLVGDRLAIQMVRAQLHAYRSARRAPGHMNRSAGVTDAPNG